MSGLEIDNTDNAAIRGLWSAVLQRALRDGTGVVESSAATSAGAARATRVSARAWFTRESSDYRFVCEAAEINPERVRRVALDMFDAGTKLPARGQPLRGLAA